MKRQLIATVIGLIVAIAPVGCGGEAGVSSGSAAVGSALPTPMTASPPIASATPVRVSPLPAEPPTASLAAEGGDPVQGQLGTYTWGDAGSDAPWLPGAPIAVGAGEPLTVAFEPDVDVTVWSAARIPAGAEGNGEHVSMGTGTGAPTITAPGPGSWSVVVTVGFGSGEASYFWRLDVS